MVYAGVFLFCWLVVPLIAQRRLRQTYPETWTLRADHRPGFVLGVVAAGLVWAVWN